MTERKTGGQDGLRVRRVHMKPGVVVELVPPGGQKVLDREAEKARRNAALGAARGFFHENAQDIAFSMSGAVEDRDRIPDEGLRAVTIGLMDTGLGTDDVIRDVLKSLREKPFGDTNLSYSIDAARAYGRLLAEERDRILEERIAQDVAASKSTQKPRSRS